MTLIQRTLEDIENEDKYAFSSLHEKSRINKEQTYSPENYVAEERVKTYDGPKRLNCETNFKVVLIILFYRSRLTRATRLLTLMN